MHRVGNLQDYFPVTTAQLVPLQSAKKSFIFLHPTSKGISLLEISLCLGYALQDESCSFTVNRNVPLERMRHV